MLARPGLRTKLVTAAVLVLVFGTGVLLGMAADRAAGGAVAEASGSGTPPEGGAALSGEGERRRRPPIYEKMNPTPEQSVVIDSIMRAHREKMNQLHAEFRVARDVYETSFDALVLETREAIAAVFPPEKRDEYRRLLAQRDSLEAVERERDGRR
jgi:hypothetical protein